MVVSFGDIQAGEVFGASHGLREGADGREGKGVQQGPAVELPEVPTWAVLAIGFWLQM